MIEDLLCEETIDVDLLRKEERKFLNKVNKEAIDLLEESTLACQQFIRVVAVKDGLVAEKSKDRQHYAYLIRDDCFELMGVVDYQPDDADNGADVGQQSLQLAEDGVRNEAEERPMFVYNNRAVVGFREGLMMVRREDVRLVFVFATG